MSGQRSRRIAWVALVALCSGLTPVAALPDPPVILDLDPPSLEVTVAADDDPFAIQVEATARDADGRIRSLELCVSDGISAWTCALQTAQADPAGDVAACTSGDERAIDTGHALDAWGWHLIRARTAGGVCPGRGSSWVGTKRAIPIAPAFPPIPCAQTGPRNATDVGVDADTVRIGALVSRTGKDADPTISEGLRAAVEVVNRTGGVCGRMLALTLKDDMSVESVASEAFDELMSEPLFALVSMHGWRGLDIAASDGRLSEADIPVIGSHGLSPSEFTHDLIWPLGAGPAVFAEAAVEDAYRAGARSFAVVVQDDVSGHASAATLTAAILDRPDTEVRFVGHTGMAGEMRALCGSAGCDAMLLDLDAPQASFWMTNAQQQGSLPTIMTAASARSASKFVDCGEACDEMRVWSAIDLATPGASDAAMHYAVETSESGPFLHGPAAAAYASVMIAARAMGAGGVDLTRDAVGAVLDGRPVDTGLTAVPLEWSLADRSANRWMRPYVVGGDSFFGLAQDGGWVAVP